MRILQVADRPGWAIDRLSKPLSEIYDNVDMSYFSIKPDRYLDSGYTAPVGNVHYTHKLGNKYDVVHFHRLEAAIIDIDQLDLKVKRVLTVHTERHEDFDDIRLMLFDTIICPTKYAYNRLKKNLIKWKDVKTELFQVAYGIDINKYIRDSVPYHLPHGIDLEKYVNLSKPPRSNEVGYVGRVVPWKRYSIIQKSVHQAGLKLIACGFIQYGQLQNVHNLIDKKDFEFYSFLPEPLMIQFYSRMNMFICLSKPHIEAGPLPILEAMACGIPVISTPIGWAKDNCEHLKNIYFIEQDKLENLTSTLKMLYEDNTLRNKLKQGGLKLIKNFSIEKYAKQLMTIYGLH